MVSNQRFIAFFAIALIALGLGHLLGGTWLLTNFWFNCALAGGASAAVAAIFGRYRHGRWIHGDPRVSAARPAFVGLLMGVLCYVPWTPEFVTLVDDPHLFQGLFLIIIVLTPLFRKYLQPGGVQYGVVIGLNAALMDFTFSHVNAFKDPANVFTNKTMLNAALNASGEPAVWYEAGLGFLFLVLVVLFSATVIAPLAGVSRASRVQKGFWFVPVNTAAVFNRGGLIFWFVNPGNVMKQIASRHLVPMALVIAAMRDGDWDQVREAQLNGWNRRGQVRPTPIIDYTRPDEAYWAGVWQQRVQDQTAMHERLADITLGAEPDGWVLDEAVMPGFPGWIAPHRDSNSKLFRVTISESGREVQLPREYVDLKLTEPIELISDHIQPVPGIMFAVHATYRMQVKWIETFVQAQKPEVTIEDSIKHVLGQFGLVVGPWMVGFRGDPLSDPRFGGIQRGLVVDEQARAATAFSRAAVMLNGRPAVRVGPQQNIINMQPAYRPAFEILKALWVQCQWEILRHTGVWVSDLQIDYVDLPDHMQQSLEEGARMSILATFVDEAAAVQSAAQRGKMLGVIQAVAASGLPQAQQTEVLKKAVEYLPLSQGSSPVDLLLMAGRATGINAARS